MFGATWIDSGIWRKTFWMERCPEVSAIYLKSFLCNTIDRLSSLLKFLSVSLWIHRNVAENFLTGSLYRFGSLRSDGPKLLNASYNFFTNVSDLLFPGNDFGGCPIKGVIQFDVKGNCLSPSVANCSSSISPRSSSECLAFCDVLNTEGQCGGSGTCVIDSSDPIVAHCDCDEGLIQFNQSCSLKNDTSSNYVFTPLCLFLLCWNLGLTTTASLVNRSVPIYWILPKSSTSTILSQLNFAIIKIILFAHGCDRGWYIIK